MLRQPVACLLLLLALVATDAAAQDFELPVNISQTTGNSLLPTIVASGSEVHAFWFDFTSAPNLLWCAEDTGAGWTASGVCVPNETASWSPVAVMDSLDRIHLVWRDRTDAQDEIFYALRGGSGWSAPVNISRNAGRSSNPTIAVDPAGNPHVLWEDDSGGAVAFWEAHHDGSDWSAAADTRLLFDEAAFLDTIEIASDALGYLHAVWHDDVSVVPEVYYAQRPPSGPWGAREPVSVSPLEFSAEPDVAVDNEGKAHVVWAEQEPTIGMTSAVFYSIRFAGGSWSAPAAMTQFIGNVFRPTIAIAASDGVPRMAWTATVDAGEIYFLAAPGDTPMNVSRSATVLSERAALALDPSGRAIVAWQERSGAIWDVFVAAQPREDLVIRAVKDTTEGDVVLAWTGGSAPFEVGRSLIPDVTTGWEEQARGPNRTWRDVDVLEDGADYYYGVRGN